MYRQACFGRQYGVLASACQRQPDDPLGFRPGINIRGIYEVNSLIKRGMNNINRGLLVGSFPERVGSQAQRRHLQPAVAQTVKFHFNSLLI
ncbi:hypothetical protein D3C75_1212880 [compost metagenome]